MSPMVALVWGETVSTPDGGLSFETRSVVNRLTTPGTIALGLLSEFLPLGLALFAVQCHVGLFASYAEGDVLTRENGRRLRHLGLALVLSLPVGALSSVLRQVALALSGAERVVIDLEFAYLDWSLIGLHVLVIGWIMEEAVRLKEEQDLVV